MSVPTGTAWKAEYRWGEIGALLGLVMSIVFSAWLIKVQAAPDRAGVPIAILYAAIMVAPFLISLVAIRRRWQRTKAVLLVSGLVAVLIGFLSLVTWLLFLPAALLILAAVRREGAGRR